MNIKNATLYRYIKYFKMAVVFYALLAALAGVITLARHLYPYETDGINNFKTVHYLSMIFIFILGYLSFKEEHSLFAQNGLTRQSSHFSFILSMPVCILFALAERLYTTTMNAALKIGYMHYMENYFMVQNKSFLLDVVFETLCFACILAFGYLVAVWSVRVKLVYRILTVIVIAFGIITEYALADSSLYESSKMLPEIAYVPQIMLFGSGIGEFVTRHYIVIHILLIAAMLSAAHIMALGINVNGKEKRS